MSLPWSGRLGWLPNWGKLDLTNAYKHVLVHPDYWHMLGIHVGDQPECKFHVETTLPDHHLVPKIFTAFSDVLVWVAWKFGAEALFKCMDDFASVQPACSGLCQHDLNAIQATCHLTGFEEQDGKEEGPTTCLDVLSIDVNTIAWELRISEKKLHVLGSDLEQIF